MRNYILNKTLIRFKKNIKLNLIIILQIIFACFLLCMAININSSINKEYKNYIKTGTDKIYTINYTNLDITNEGSNSELNNEHPPLTLEQYTSIKNNFPNVNVDLVINTLIFSFATGEFTIDKDGTRTIPDYTIRYTSKVNSISASRGFIDMLEKMNEKNTPNISDVPFVYSDGFVNINNKKEPVNIIESEEYIINIPIGLYFSQTIHSTRSDASLFIKLNDSDVKMVNETVNHIVDYLKESSNGQYKYSLDNEYADFISKAWEDKESSQTATISAIALLCIVFIGMVGLFMLLSEQRKFELAICKVTGARDLQLGFEFFLEAIIITLVGAVVGIALATILINNKFQFIMIEINQTNPVISLLIILGTIMSSMIALIPTYIKIVRLMPYEILQEC